MCFIEICNNFALGTYNQSTLLLKMVSGRSEKGLYWPQQGPCMLQDERTRNGLSQIQPVITPRA